MLGDLKCGVHSWIKSHHGKEYAENPPRFKCQDWHKTVRETDSKNTIFVLDPPWEKCAVGRRNWGWKCDPSKMDKLIDDVIDRARTVQGKAIVNLGPEHRDRMCDKLKCRAFTIRQGKKDWRYLIGVKPSAG